MKIGLYLEKAIQSQHHQSIIQKEFRSIFLTLVNQLEGDKTFSK